MGALLLLGYMADQYLTPAEGIGLAAGILLAWLALVWYLRRMKGKGN